MINITEKIHQIGVLQIKEYKIYERFYISLEKRVREILPQLNQPEILNEMLVEKKNLIREIGVIEEELSPFRKEIIILSKEGKLENIVDDKVIDKLKQNDMGIIEIISNISKLEQELTGKIKEHMELIRERIQNIGQKKKINSNYKNKSFSYSLDKNENEGLTSFNTVG